MKKFKFNLQRVLEFRKVLRKESEQELALRNNQLAKAEECLGDILDKQENADCIENTIVSMAEMMVNKEYHQALQLALERQRIVVLEAAQTVEIARDMYLAKLKDEEILNKLREKRKEEHSYESKQEENKTLKNYVSQRYKTMK